MSEFDPQNLNDFPKGSLFVSIPNGDIFAWSKGRECGSRYQKETGYEKDTSNWLRTEVPNRFPGSQKIPQDMIQDILNAVGKEMKTYNVVVRKTSIAEATFQFDLRGGEDAAKAKAKERAKEMAANCDLFGRECFTEYTIQTIESKACVCKDCGGLGFLSNFERCDACGKFASDEEARIYAWSLIPNKPNEDNKE